MAREILLGINSSASSAYQSYFGNVTDNATNADVSLGGECPDGDCGGKDQTENVGNGISFTAKGIEVNSQNHSENYNAKYRTKDLSKDAITKQVRSSMKSTAKGANYGGLIATATFGAYDIYQGVKNDGNTWGYHTNMAIGRTIFGGVGAYYFGKFGMAIGTGSGGPGPGSVAGAIIGSGFGAYIGSEIGEAFVNFIYNQ